MTRLGVPKRARSAWDALTLALIDVEPPCAAHPGWWWSTDPETVKAAVAACQRCPVLDPCGKYADAANEQAGVWGGVNRETPQSKQRKVAA